MLLTDKLLLVFFRTLSHKMVSCMNITYVQENHMDHMTNSHVCFAECMCGKKPQFVVGWLISSSEAFSSPCSSVLSYIQVAFIWFLGNVMSD